MTANLLRSAARRRFCFPAAIVVVLLVSVSSWQEGLLAGDWRESLSKVPGSFKKFRTTKARYEFGWSGFTAADASATFGQKPNGDCALDLSVKTTGFVRSLWKMDTHGTSVCKPATLRPVACNRLSP